MAAISERPGWVAELTAGDNHGVLIAKEGGRLYFHTNTCN
jgi:hypothetical protein